MRHFCGFAGLPRCATWVALTHVPLRALQMQMRELYDQSEYLLLFSPCFFHSSRRRKLFLDRFLQGESVAESGSIISHYFRTYFSLYVVPIGLIAELSLCSTWLTTCCTWYALHVLHMVCKRVYPGHLSVRDGDSLRRCEIVIISNCAFHCDYYYYYQLPRQ